jgi:hypothetical protein
MGINTRGLIMKTKLILITIFCISTIIHAETKAPDDVVTKSDINNCLKHLRKTEDFLYPQSLKVESANYAVKDSKIILTLKIREKTEYGGSAGIQEKQCVLDKTAIVK